MSTTDDTATDIRSFQIEIPEEQVDDLRRRIAATRWPSKELVEDRSQGVQLATLQALAGYWTTEYGFSSEPAELGWESGRIARAWTELMDRLGYIRFAAQGGDVGALVTDLL